LATSHIILSLLCVVVDVVFIKCRFIVLTPVATHGHIPSTNIKFAFVQIYLSCLLFVFIKFVLNLGL
jgi:hypothetical protein